MFLHIICQNAPVAIRTVSRNVGEGVSSSYLSPPPRPLTVQALTYAIAVQRPSEASIVPMARCFPAGALRLDTWSRDWFWVMQAEEGV